MLFEDWHEVADYISDIQMLNFWSFHMVESTIPQNAESETFIIPHCNPAIGCCFSKLMAMAALSIRDKLNKSE